MIEPEAKVYTRGKVIPDKAKLKEQGLDLNEDGELIEISTGKVTANETEVVGYVCVLDGNDVATGNRIPMEKAKFRRGFRFVPNSNCEAPNSATIITFKAKVKP